MLTDDGRPRFNRMQLFEHSALKALLTKGEAYCRGLAKKAEAREAKAATAATKRAAAVGR